MNRPKSYSLVNFREEVARQLCGLTEYGLPPIRALSKPAHPPSPDLGPFVTEHIPVLGEERRNCVACWQKEKKSYKVQSYCKAPQCNRYMHVASDKKCFELFHSPDYRKPLFSGYFTKWLMRGKCCVHSSFSYF